MMTDAPTMDRRPAPSRRVMATGLLALVLTGLSLLASPARADDFAASLSAIEKRAGGRLGVMILEPGGNRSWAYRADERFAMNSTFKAFACAALLARVDTGAEKLETQIPITSADLVPHAPVTQQHVGASMSLDALCAAATRLSDNTAANLILARIGGPKGLTAFMRTLGDKTTRLDRLEPALNEAAPGDPRDTTTPAAAARSLETLVLGDALSAGSRRRLTDWLEADAVADGLLRAALPAGWRIADRTGAGGHGSRGIIAVIWPPGRAPVVAAIYLGETSLSLAERDAVIAQVGRALVTALQ